MIKTNIDVKGILLDLDGTIVDSREAYLEAARTAYQATNQKIPNPETSLKIPKRLEQQQPLDDILGTNAASFLEVYLKRFYEITLDCTQPFPNVEKALLSLSQRAKLALITMRRVPKTSVIGELRHFGLAEYFTHVVTALDTPNPKPAPDALIKAVKLMDVGACNCIVVGDSTSDVKAGKAADIVTVAVLSGLFSRAELSRENPDVVLNNVTELPRYVDFLE